MLRWALLMGLLWGGLGLALAGGLGAAGDPAGAPRPAAASAVAAPPNTLVFRVQANGHYVVDAAVNGTPVRFMVDTGASVVALSPEDARRVGLQPGPQDFTQHFATANGETRGAPVSLREVRLGQLAMPDVAAVVMAGSMPQSLLGMSFLRRLGGYAIRDGELTMEW